VHVQLDGIRPALKRAFKRWKSIFRQLPLGSPVPDPLQPYTLSHNRFPWFLASVPEISPDYRRHLNGLSLEASTSWNA